MEAFASRDFRRYQMARAAVILGAEAQAVAVAWQVYSITHRALDLGYTGLALFLPGLLFLLPAGHVADRFDRRQVILCLLWAAGVLHRWRCLLLARSGMHECLPIYAVLFVIGTGRAFSGPASSALVPHLVPEKHFVNAVTWGGAIFQFANITGPALGGLLFTLPLSQLSARRGLQGRGHCVCLHAVHAGVVSGAGRQPARAAGPDGASGRVDARWCWRGFSMCAARRCCWDRFRWTCLWCCWAGRWR